MLQKLPIEVLLMVLEQIPSRKDLKHLCAVSKMLYNFAIPKLYENIVIWADDEWRLERAKVEPFLLTGSKLADRLNHVRTVQVRSNFHYVLEDRCIHNKDMDFCVGKPDFERQPRFEKLIIQLMLLFEQLREKSLRGFSWRMGTCVPFEILGNRGYMKNNQRLIESITLITGGSCPVNISNESQIDLSAFHSLRDISWTGLYLPEEFDNLGLALKNNSEHLRELRLDLVNWSEDDWDGDYSENIFAYHVLKLSAGRFEIMFPALEVLSLSSISLAFAEKEVAYAFNSSRLSSLTLRHCSEVEEFLEALIESGQTIQLLSLEVVYGSSDIDIDICQTLSTFLRAFQGLRDLFVTLNGPIEILRLWRAVAHHKTTLTRFVCHQRIVNLDEDSSEFEEETDLSDLSLFPDDVAGLNQPDSRHPFAELNLECIGLGCTPPILKSLLAPFVTTQTLKILHIRKSGSDMDGPMRWAGAKSFNRWDMDSDDDSMADDKWGADPDTDAVMAHDSEAEVGSFNKIISRASSESFDTAEISRLPAELLQFANWVFGPNGIPTLEVLAFGDFSYDGRFEHYNKLFCRHTWSIGNAKNDTLHQSVNGLKLRFRLIRENDRALRDLIDRNSEFLGACPVTYVMLD